jgi:VanZ family protein
MVTVDTTSRRARTVLWLLVIVWAGIIFALSATPDLRVAPTADLDFVVRKAGHMGAFGVLAVLLWRALASSAVRHALVWSWVLTVVYAASDEFHQLFTAGRHGSPLDVGIDSVGALIALVALVAWLRLLARRTGYSSATGSPRMLKPPST